MCGSFLGSPALPSVSWKLVWASLSPLSSPSMLRGLCALLSSHQACPLCSSACVHLSWPPGPAICVAGLCALVLAPQACPLCCRACVHLSRFLGPALYVMGLLHICFISLASYRACVFFWHPGSPPAPQGSIFYFIPFVAVVNEIDSLIYISDSL